MALEDMSRDDLREACKRNGIKLQGNPGVETLARLLREHAAQLDSSPNEAQPSPDEPGAEQGGPTPPSTPEAGRTAPTSAPRRRRNTDDVCRKCGHRHAPGQYARCAKCNEKL